MGPLKQKPHLSLFIFYFEHQQQQQQLKRSSLQVRSRTHASPNKTRLPVLTPSSKPKITSSQIIETAGRDNTEEDGRGRALRRTRVTLCVTLAEMLTRTRVAKRIHAHTHTCVSE